jgi:hypothetical protein
MKHSYIILSFLNLILRIHPSNEIILKFLSHYVPIMSVLGIVMSAGDAFKKESFRNSTFIIISFQCNQLEETMKKRNEEENRRCRH